MYDDEKVCLWTDLPEESIPPLEDLTLAEWRDILKSVRMNMGHPSDRARYQPKVTLLEVSRARPCDLHALVNGILKAPNKELSVVKWPSAVFAAALADNPAVAGAVLYKMGGAAKYEFLRTRLDEVNKEMVGNVTPAQLTRMLGGDETQCEVAERTIRIFKLFPKHRELFPKHRKDIDGAIAYIPLLVSRALLLNASCCNSEREK